MNQVSSVPRLGKGVLPLVDARIFKRASWITLAAGTALLAAYAAGAAPGEQFLDGRWRVVHMVRDGKRLPLAAEMTLTMEFQASGRTWSFTVQTPEQTLTEAGTWRLNGSELVTRTYEGDRIERIRVGVINPDEMELGKPGERLQLKRHR